MKNRATPLCSGIVTFLLFFTNTIFAQVVFTDVSKTSGISSPTNAPSYNSQWIDLDNDDLLDLYIARGNAANHMQPELYKNLGNGKFQNLSATAFGSRSPAYNGHICWGDYDNDGFIDLYENHFDGNDNRLWHNEGNLTFGDSSSITFNTGGYSTGDVWTDFDTNGFVDLAINTQAGRGTFEVKNDSGKKFEQVNLFQNGGQGHLMLSMDLNLDGVPDFYIGNIHSLDQCWLSSNKGYIKMDNSFLDKNRDNDGFMTAAFADINNDGYPDLLYGQNQHLFLLLNDSARTFKDITASSGLELTPGVYRSSYIQDIDNDGYLDIILFEYSGITEIWYGSATGVYKKDAPSFPTQSVLESVLSWTDYDNDGFLDLLVVTPEFTNLYHNNGNANRWLNVTLKGHKANTKGIGGRVIAYSEGKVQYREIGYNQSTLGYSPLMAHFGFGATGCSASSEFIDSVVVIWQPGGRQVIKNVRYNELVVIDQDSGIVRSIQRPLATSYGYAFPYFLGAYSTYPDTTINVPMAVRIPHNFVQLGIIPDEITFGIEYNSDIIDISPTKVGARYTPPPGWTFKSSNSSKDSLIITITNSGGVTTPDSLILGSLRFDTYKAKALGTYIFLDQLVVRAKGNNYAFCHNYEGDFLGEVMIIDRPVIRDTLSPLFGNQTGSSHYQQTITVHDDRITDQGLKSITWIAMKGTDSTKFKASYAPAIIPCFSDKNTHVVTLKQLDSTVAGCYQFTFEDCVGNKGYDTICIAAHSPAGVEENSNGSLGIEILPNPSSGNFVTVRLTSSNPASAQIIINDMLGKEVYRYDGEGSVERIGIQNFNIPTSQLAGGTYIVRLNSGGKILTGKFTVVR